MSNPNVIGDWPAKDSRLADAAHVHAIGQFSLMYNYLEQIFGLVFQCSFPANGDYSEALFQKLNNRERCDMLEALVRFGEANAALRQLIFDAIRYFGICTENRNIVMHAIAEADAVAGIFRISKKAKNEAGRINFYEVPLETLRRIADDTTATFTLWSKLLYWLRARQMGERLRSLPDIPPQPYTLSPLQPRSAKADDSRPPGSSRR
jgi:hypothetical protein